MSDKPFRCQRRLRLTNDERSEAFGLHVEFEEPVRVCTAPPHNAAGPFQDIGGNGTTTVELTNPLPSMTIDPGRQVVLTCRTDGESIQVGRWWWMRKSGKKRSCPAHGARAVGTRRAKSPSVGLVGGVNPTTWIRIRSATDSRDTSSPRAMAGVRCR